MKKRLLAAVVAGATMFSTVQVAQAQTNDGLEELGEAIKGLEYVGKFSSDIHEANPDYDVFDKGYSKPAAGSANTSSELSSEKPGQVAKDLYNVAGSSVKNDARQNYPIGTTWDILWGVGIAAGVVALLGVLAQNLGLPIPGLGR